MALVLEEARQERLAVPLRKRVESVVQVRGDLLPHGFCSACLKGGVIHANLLFAALTPQGFPRDVCDRISCGAMQPSGEDGAAWQGTTFLSQGDEYGLGDVLGRVCVSDSPEGSLIDQPSVTVHQLAECLLGIPLRVVFK